MKTLIIGGKGYIGSALQKHIDADVLDLTSFVHWKTCRWDIQNYDTIILLAGHSSMQLGRDDPDGAWLNNVVRFKVLLEELRDDQRLIYASSASVYNNIAGHPNEENKIVDVMNMYDLSKWIIDQLALHSGKHTYGLRFCTVNGFSPVLRVDLMLNKMCEDAKNTGKVTIKNGDLERPLLGIQDACRAIKAIVESDEDHRGIYNLCSIKGKTVRDYAEAAVAAFGGEIEDLGAEPHYVYGADTTKFEKTYGFEFIETVDSIVNSLKEEPDVKVIRTLENVLSNN